MSKHQRSVPLTCQQCGCTFLVEPYRASVARFCGNDCSNARRAGDAVPRFWALVRRAEGCWRWQGRTDKEGYGLFHAQDRGVRAHRYSYALANGPVPSGACVLHRCDNPACVRPDHLFIGTQQDNMADKGAKGRQVKGVRVNTAKLTEALAVAIRARFAEGVSMMSLARQHGLTHKTVWCLIRRKSWKHV